MSRVFVIDDEQAVCWSLEQLFRDEGHLVTSAASVEEAMPTLSELQPDVVFLDVRLPGMDGLTAMPRIREAAGDVPIILMTAFGDLPTAIRAMEAGAFEYIVKPFDLEGAAASLRRALRRSGAGASMPAAPQTTDALIGRSPPMQHVFQRIAIVAPSDLPVLLVGETGVGKELAARAIHDASRWKTGPFVPVCLAALSPSVVESELFGHVRGAFTGAIDDRVGLFETARGGTLFLDEIGDTPLSLQVKLLRVLETGRFCRVGSTKEEQVDVRVIAAVHRPLHSLVEAGKFREDLLHRLSVFQIDLPPLRDRIEDVQRLATQFIQQMKGAPLPASVDDGFWRALECRTWTGNVRELRNAVECAVVMSRGGVLEDHHLPPPVAEPRGSTSTHASSKSTGNGTRTASTITSSPEELRARLVYAVEAWTRYTVAQMPMTETADLYRDFLGVAEVPLLMAVMQRVGNNRSAAARLLGLDRSTLRQKLLSFLPPSDDDSSVVEKSKLMK